MGLHGKHVLEELDQIVVSGHWHAVRGVSGVRSIVLLGHFLQVVPLMKNPLQAPTAHSLVLLAAQESQNRVVEFHLNPVIQVHYPFNARKLESTSIVLRAPEQERHLFCPENQR